MKNLIAKNMMKNLQNQNFVVSLQAEYLYFLLNFKNY